MLAISIIFTISLSYNVGDCIKFTIPNSEGTPMLITDKGDGWYQVFYVYPKIGDISFRAIAKKLEEDTKIIDDSYCSPYRDEKSSNKS